MSRPWAIDDLDIVVQRLQRHGYKKALLFVDNAGSDVILGRLGFLASRQGSGSKLKATLKLGCPAGMLPLARELVQQGTQVVLAANSVASINDVTAHELSEILREAAHVDRVLDRAVSEQALTVVPSGNDLPVIDLSQVTSQPPAVFLPSLLHQDAHRSIYGAAHLADRLLEVSCWCPAEPTPVSIQAAVVRWKTGALRHGQ